ncbi:MAG: hypothetical protein A2464_12600 [Deltaproteobacteria bacterium RIFOXYC2_FULL_48_10]|nr:MAG: hypothetical protein A2464_12600 [Deltaproteobacteria bacterium RIFOXYC2_FULL_48_10]
MKKNNSVIRILPHDRQIRVENGATLLENFIRHGIFLRSDCGGKGVCGKCRVFKISGAGAQETIESCMYVVSQDLAVHIPESAMLSSHIMTKAPVIFPEAFKRRFRTAKGKDEFGIAVDLGTTTIAVYLCNMARGRVVSSVAVKNPQAIYGDDVMSRIGVIGRDPRNLKKLQALAVKSIEWGIHALVSRFSDKPLSPGRMVVVGNPVMIHILAGVDPAPIGISPYLPAFYEAAVFRAGDLGFAQAEFSIHTLPQVSGFIGGDTLAASLAVDMKNQPVGALLVDLGTNGELVLKSEDRLFATSCATGPAFEGASLSCGMQAGPGAINAVTIDDHQKVTAVSLIHPNKAPEIKPAGICGAGVLNIVAQLCDKRIIAPDGRFNSGGDQYVLVPENPAGGQLPVYISQKDIRSVQLGKSALISGIEFLLKRAGLKAPEKIIIAGAFGSHLDPSDLIRLGMIPKTDPGKIETAGNAAGSGAVMALCDPGYMNRAARMAGHIEVVDLALDIQFQEVFVGNLGFPEVHPLAAS